MNPLKVYMYELWYFVNVLVVFTPMLMLTMFNLAMLELFSSLATMFEYFIYEIYAVRLQNWDYNIYSKLQVMKSQLHNKNKS